VFDCETTREWYAFVEGLVGLVREPA